MRGWWQWYTAQDSGEEHAFRDRARRAERPCSARRFVDGVTMPGAGHGHRPCQGLVVRPNKANPTQRNTNLLNSWARRI